MPTRGWWAATATRFRKKRVLALLDGCETIPLPDILRLVPVGPITLGDAEMQSS